MALADKEPVEVQGYYSHFLSNLGDNLTVVGLVSHKRVSDVVGKLRQGRFLPM
jgi:hypothetical protein